MTSKTTQNWCLEPVSLRNCFNGCFSPFSKGGFVLLKLQNAEKKLWFFSMMPPWKCMDSHHFQRFPPFIFAHLLQPFLSFIMAHPAGVILKLHRSRSQLSGSPAKIQVKQHWPKSKQGGPKVTSCTLPKTNGWIPQNDGLFQKVTGPIKNDNFGYLWEISGV